MKRTIFIDGLNMELELSKVASVKTDKKMIHLDELKDGTWRLIYNGNMIPDFSKINNFKIIRE
jgi:hypothetical protein